MYLIGSLTKSVSHLSYSNGPRLLWIHKVPSRSTRHIGVNEVSCFIGSTLPFIGKNSAFILLTSNRLAWSRITASPTLCSRSASRLMQSSTLTLNTFVSTSPYSVHNATNSFAYDCLRLVLSTTTFNPDFNACSIKAFCHLVISGSCSCNRYLPRILRKSSLFIRTHLLEWSGQHVTKLRLQLVFPEPDKPRSIIVFCILTSYTDEYIFYNSCYCL